MKEAARSEAGMAGVFQRLKKRFGKRNEEKGREIFIDKDEDTLEPAANTKIANGKFAVCGVVVNHKGCVRKNNEDNFCLNGIYMERRKMDEGAFYQIQSEDETQIYAVCDGMGGADCGEEASYLAVCELTCRREKEMQMADSKTLTAVLCAISEQIYEEAEQRKQKSGTTVAMLVLQKRQMVFANVGDSRIYRFRNQELTQISRDHSKVQKMIAMGLLTPEQARTDPRRHVITQYLGMPPEIRLSPYVLLNEEVCDGDIYMLCSDGLTDMVEEPQIEAVLREKQDVQNAAQTLLEIALANGGRDNVTVMLVRIDENNRISEK